MAANTSARLSDVLEARAGFASGAEASDGIFQVRMNNVTRDGRWDFAKKRYVPVSGKPMDRFLLRQGDVLFNATNSPELVGKNVLVKHLDEPAVFSNHFLRLRTDPRRIDPGFLSRWLQREFERGVFEATCQRWVNQAAITRDRLLSMDVPLPPLEEQRRIAQTLDAADALRTKARHVLARLESLIESVFEGLFGEPVSNPLGWPMRTVGEVATAQGGLQVAATRASNPIETPYLRVANVHRGRLNLDEVKPLRVTAAELARCALQPGDLLVVEGHGNTDEIGRAAL